MSGAVYSGASGANVRGAVVKVDREKSDKVKMWPWKKGFGHRERQFRKQWRLVNSFQTHSCKDYWFLVYFHLDHDMI